MEDLDREIRKVLREISDLIGKGNLRILVVKIIGDLKAGNPNLVDLNVPEDPTCIDLSRLSEEEKRAFLYMLMDIGGFVAGGETRQRLLKRYNT